MRESVSSKPYHVDALLVESGFLLIEWPPRIDESINAIVVSVAQRFRSYKLEGVIDVVPTYHSIGIYFDDRLSADDILGVLRGFDFEMPSRVQKDVIEVPVCYDGEFGIDLDSIAEMKSLSVDEIIEAHVAPIYRVNFIGFLPGFMYLSGLDGRISAARRSVPRTRIPAGAVAIGGQQTGIYPQSSPGGWHIIGRCPLVLFDMDKAESCKFQAGDRISFKPISIAEYRSLNEHKGL